MFHSNSIELAPVIASYEFEQYKDINSRRDAFARVIQNEDYPVKSPFCKWDYIGKGPVSESLAEQGMIPSVVREIDTRLNSRRIVPNPLVACVFCQSEFTVQGNKNPLAQHLTQSVDKGFKTCPFALKFMDTYPAERNPFYEDDMPADDPRTGMENNLEPAGATAMPVVERRPDGASGETEVRERVGGSSAFSRCRTSDKDGGRNRSAHVLPEDRYHGEQTQATRKLGEAIIRFFKASVVTVCNPIDSRKFAEYIMVSHPEQQAVSQLTTFMNKLDKRGDKCLVQRLAMKKVFEAFEYDSSLVGDICALAGTIEDGCIDRRTEVLDRMVVRCSLYKLYQLPEEQAIYWVDFLTVLKKQFHEEGFDNLFNHFKYGPLKKKRLVQHKESSEVRGFYKHLLNIGCEFSSEGFGLVYPGYECPQPNVFYKFQKQFFEKIKNNQEFYEFLRKIMAPDYEKAFEFIRLHDEDFNALIQKIDSELELEMEKIESVKDQVGDEEYNNRSVELCVKRDENKLEVFYKFLQDRVQKNWDAIQEKVVRGSIRPGLSSDDLKKVVNGEIVAQDVLQPLNPQLSQEEIARLEWIAGI